MHLLLGSAAETKWDKSEEKAKAAQPPILIHPLQGLAALNLLLLAPHQAKAKAAQPPILIHPLLLLLLHSTSCFLLLTTWISGSSSGFEFL